MLINSKRNLQRPPRRLPKQSALPSRQQLRSLFLETEQYTNSLVELPFGEPPESYSLTVLRERPGANCQWNLYRGEGPTSALEWSHTTNDWEKIYSLICALYPGLELKGKVLVDQEITAKHTEANLLTDTGSHLPIK